MVDWAQLQLAGEAGSVFVGVLIVFLFLMFRLRRRRRILTDELDTSREVRDDRAYNQIQLARAAADRLERAGADVGPVRRRIDEAEAARARRDTETALAVARSAQEALVRLQQEPVAEVPLSAGAVGAAAPRSGSYGPSSTASIAPPMGPAGLDLASLPDRSDAADEAPVGRLPKNKAEAHFQLTLLADEIGAADGKGGPSADLTEAKTFLADARSAYDRADYTEALRLGLKGRRRVGGRLETLAPSAATHPEASLEGRPASPTSSAAGARCSNCGQPMRPGDRFCRGCGSSNDAARCRNCGQALAADDRFCGACGETVRT